MRTRLTYLLAIIVITAMAIGPAGAAPKEGEKNAVAVGTGGAVATVDPVATQAGVNALRRGGNAIDAAVIAAGVLGVTEPYSAGIGGGGFMVIYLAEEERVVTIDGREEAPSDPAFDNDVFIEDGVAIPFFPERITSGLSVGVPGTLATWADALERYGTISLARALQPGRIVAQRGFVVDQTFADQTAGNLERFRAITSTADTFLVDGEVPAVGSAFVNKDLAQTYRLIQRNGPEAFYTGPLAQEIVDTVLVPPVADDAPFEVRPGLMSTDDLAAYEVLHPEPTMSEYRDYDVFGMGPPSSGGITVGEALNIGDTFELDAVDDVAFQHHTLEATALAFADRNAYIGDDRFTYVPVTGLLSEEFAEERAELIDPGEAAIKPVAPGDPCEEDGNVECVAAADAAESLQGTSTTHLVTADRWGNVVSYTLTIEATGGSGITVPGRGFILNNELTDFNSSGDGPNLPQPGKRPRSSMSPTIVLDDGEPFLAVGSPGGSTIITTVAAILQQRIDRGVDLPTAIATPRATQRNTGSVVAEADYLVLYEAGLGALGHTFSPTGELGAAVGIEILDDGRFLAAAEPVRRGGGDAGVVRPSRTRR